MEIELEKNKVWNTRLISMELYGSKSPANLKKAERWLIEKGLNFPCVSENEIYDEYNRKSKANVTEYLIKSARKKRKSVLFTKIYKISNELKILFLNDGRNGRRWIFIKSKEICTNDLEKILELLVSFEKKNIIIFPIGNLVKKLRKITRNWNSNHKILGNTLSIHVALEIFSHSLDDINLYISKPYSVLKTKHLSHLDRLEAESIHIMREVVSEAINPVMLYSLGKDSSVMLHLARKAFYPSVPPFPLLHVDTRWKFKAMYDFRDFIVKESGMKLIIHVNPEGIEKNINPFDHGSNIHTDIMKTQSLKQAITRNRFDVAFGGARRDEEKSRAKERIFSFRTVTHQWDPKNQRPELWHLYNCRKSKNESIRVFPLSNWTELDIWLYIYKEKIPIVPLYFAAERPVINRDGTLLMVDDDRLKLLQGEKIEIERVRFRTLGCYPLTGAIKSEADDLPSIVLELLSAKTSERQGRTIDLDPTASMEIKKREGYF